MRAATIFKTLEHGKEVTVRLPLPEAKSLRSQLATMKFRLEQKFERIGVPFDRLTLSMEYDENSQVALFRLAKKSYKQYEILEIITPAPQAEEEGETDV